MLACGGPSRGTLDASSPDVWSNEGVIAPATLVSRLEQTLEHALLGVPPDGPMDPCAPFGGRPAPPFALYVHVPFCGALCSYCSFNKQRAHGDMGRYVDAVCAEADLWAGHPAFAAPRVTSVFAGGGTPSFLPAPLFERMLGHVLPTLRVGPTVQVSVEANPESLDEEKLRAMRRAGVTRLSVGVQTFDEAQLKALGRRHRQEDIARAVEGASATFGEVSIDLMFGLPGQTMTALEQDVERAIALPITHLSLFPVVYRPGTAMRRKHPEGHGAGGRDRLWRMYDVASRRLERAGFRAYTSEDFTRSGTECHYQIDMWEPPVKGTLGLGAGSLSGFSGFAWHNLGPLADYSAAVRAGRLPIARGRRMSRRERMVEHLLVGLHSLGVHPARFEQELGVPLWSLVGPAPHFLRALGLLDRRADGTWVPTRRGRFAIAHAWTGFVLAQLAHASEDLGASPGRASPGGTRVQATFHRGQQPTSAA